MSRGLGDDPLSRRKKQSPKRSGVSAVSPGALPQVDAPENSSSTAQPAAQNIAEATSSSPISLSSSYNDVFWRRREAEPKSTITPAAQETHEAAVVPEPVLAQTVAAPPEPPLTQEEQHPPEPAIAEAPAAAPAPASVPETAPPIEAPAPRAVEQPEPQKTGFFSRLFGRGRK